MNDPPRLSPATWHYYACCTGLCPWIEFYHTTNFCATVADRARVRILARQGGILQNHAEMGALPEKILESSKLISKNTLLASPHPFG
jgi:hypothetical protein